MVEPRSPCLQLTLLPDMPQRAQQRRQQAMALAQELVQFERPMPVMDEYDLLLSDTQGDIQ